jgi:hemoglobin
MNTNLALVRTFSVLSLVAVLAACSGMRSAPEKSLYDRLGGKPAIQAVVDDFIGNVAADGRINGFFANTDIPRLNIMLVNQICEATGGPCKYEGRSMKAAHDGMGVTDAHFNALVDDLVKSLNKFKVPEQEKNELLTALASMKGDIVAR